MPTQNKPAYVPFFESTLSALSNLSPEDVASYVRAIHAYVYEGIEPECMGDDANCTPVAKAVFEMGRFQLDETLRRSEINRSNAKARRKRRKSDGRATEERTGSEPVATDERTPSETVATEERRKSDGRATEERNGICSNNQVSNINISSSSSSKGAGEDFEIPSLDAWTAYFNGKCIERGIPPSSEQARTSWVYYEDHGWCHKDGEPFKNWHRQCGTCISRYAKDIEKRGRGSSRNENRGRSNGTFIGAARDFDQGAIDVESIA